jgi:hypothetical protein
MDIPGFLIFVGVSAGLFGNGKFENRAWKAMLAPSNPIGQPRRAIAHQ